MIVYNSMLFVVVVLMLLYNMQHPDLRYRLTHKVPWVYAIIPMAYITLWAALRSAFVDTRAYVVMFKSAHTGIVAAFEALEGEKSQGFEFIQILFKTFISSDYHAWLSFIAIATAVPIMVEMRRRSVDYLYSIFLFVSSTLVIWMFNGIRQFCVAAIYFACSALIANRKLLKYLIVVLLCSTIHNTALILLPMYFFVTDKPFGKRMMIFVLAVLFCAVSIAPLMGAMETVLEDTAYAKNLQQFAEDDGVHPLRVMLSAIPVLLAWYKRREIASRNDNFMTICVNMSTIGAGLYFVGMFTSGIMVGRLPAYFTLFSFVLIPYLINIVYNRQRKLFYFGFTVVYLVFYWIMAQNYYYVSDILGNYA